MSFLSPLAIASACICMSGLSAMAQTEAQITPAPIVTPIAHPYPLTTCIVSGEDLGEGDEAIIRVVDGREVRFCCEGCTDEYAENTEAFNEKIDAAIIKQQLMHYPITTCIVGKGELGEMGEPINLVHNNRLVQFCCKGCLPKFKEDPDKYIAELDQMILESQIENYPLTTCVVGKGELGGMGEPINIVYMNRLVRFCCKGCLPEFKKNPAAYMATIDAAYADQQREDYPLKTCVVAGGDLGDMGEPFELVAGTQLVRFCCEGCVDDFKAEPHKYLGKIAAASSDSQK